YPEMFQVVEKSKSSELPDHTYFNDFGMVISRGKQEIPFSIALKAGHNAENHNHSDVGTYSLVLNDEIIAGDIGAPSYRAGSFSPDNKARSSWGHPVPKVNNTLQSNGIEFKGIITETDFSDQIDKVVMDILPAYELPMLKTLERTVTNNKSGKGTIIIEDHFVATEPVSFGSAIMTLNEYEIVDGKTVILKTANQQVKAEIKGKGFEFHIKDEKVPVEHLREGGPAYKIGIEFTEPSVKGILTIKFTPIS
ncbi:MAG: hypothetical protein ABJD98_07755, partial [Maribacter dokdonensis]